MNSDTTASTEYKNNVNPFAASAAIGAAISEGDNAVEARTFVTFELAGQWIAVDVANVREILDRQVVTPLPQASADVSGVIDVRGASVIVVDLPSRLGFAPSPESADTRFLVFEFAEGANQSQPIAVQADKVLEVSQIADTEIEAPPADSDEWNQDLIKGIARTDDRLIMVIDFTRVFRSSQGMGDDIFDFETAD